jgi:GH24 family phage-related lysozyme (muramidase)
MPKIPTFKATGSIEQLAGTTSNIQMGLNNTLASALAPVTETVVNFKIKENELENRTDSLKLKNDFIFESDKVTDHINKDPFLSTNKNAANKYLIDNTTLLMNKFAAQASSPNSAQIFKNSALRDISKQISSLDKDLSNNILQKATTVYGTSKKEMFLKAYTKGGMYKDALEDDYRDLITNSFTNIVTYPELQTMLSNVKNEIQLLDGSQDVSKSPRKTLQLLKNEKYLPDINMDQRQDLKDRAISILRPQIRLEYENVLENIAAGRKPPYFDWDILPDVMTESVAEAMMVNKTVVEDEFDNVKFLSGLPLDKLDEVADELIKNGYDIYPIDVAKKKETFLRNIVATQKEGLKNDPADFILKTDIEMQNKAIEIQNMTANFTAPNSYNDSHIVAAKSSFAEELLMKEEALKVKESNKKVMTNEMSKQFVEDYMEASKKSDLETMRLMTDSLNNTYGDNDGKALKQLLEDGLPYGAKIQTIFKNEKLAEEALSFDTPEEKTAFKNFLTNKGLKFEDISILVREELAPFEDILKRNVPLNSDGTLIEMDKLVEFLTFLAAKKMYSPLDLDENEAAVKAAEDFSNNFEIAETFYVNRRVNGKDIGDERVNKFINTADSVRRFHLDDLNIVAFKSNFETDPVKLTSEMMRQMSMNGEWRNPSDGDGLIFGINTTNGFALAINTDGNEIRLRQGDEIVPGTNIPIQFALRLDVLEENVVTSIIDTYEEAFKESRLQGITYEEALKQIEKPIIENIELGTGKKNSKNPIDDKNNQSSMLQFDENSQPRFVGSNNNIDEKVLGLFEYGKDKGLKGLVPNNKGIVIGQSGVTIAMGYDLGSKTLNELETMFPKNPEIVNKLKPYLGLKGKKALDAVNKMPFTITENERETINKFATKKTLEELTSAWSKTTKNNKNATIKSFDKLPKEVATVIFSVAWQHGVDTTTGYNFWKQVTTGDWDGAIKNLRDWDSTGKPSQTQSRRDQEADILEKWLNTTSKKS